MRAGFPVRGRRASLRAGRLAMMTGLISDSRVLEILNMLSAGLDDEALVRRSGLGLTELTPVLRRLASFGLVRRQRHGQRARWDLSGTRVVAWLASGHEIAESLRRT